MGTFFRFLIQMPFFKPVLRLVIGFLAIPMFRLFLRRGIRVHDLDPELEKDLEQWFRGSVLLLVAPANMEQTLFGWIPVLLGWVDPGSTDTGFDGKGGAFFMAMRIMLAIGVTEAMPDQELFRIIHPGPRFRFPKQDRVRGIVNQIGPCLKGLVCQHLDRSSQVFAILSAIFTGTTGWVCYTLAVVQYLIIGLVTSRDRALDVLSAFDRQVTVRRRELLGELGEGTSPASTPADPPPASSGAAADVARHAADRQAAPGGG